MSDTINIFSQDIRNRVRVTHPKIKGVWVEFFDDVPAKFENEYKQKESELGNIEIGYWSATQTIADWSIGDQDGNKLPIAPESLHLMPLKLQRWIIEKSVEVTLLDSEEEKKSSQPD